MLRKKIIKTASLFALSCIICAGCGFEKKTVPNISSAEIDRHVPDVEVTLEDKIKQVTDAYTTIQNSYKKAKEAAASTSASEEGKQAVQNFEDTYGDRIKELEEIDFSTLSEDEIDNLMSELREMVTAIRSTNDMLSF